MFDFFEVDADDVPTFLPQRSFQTIVFGEVISLIPPTGLLACCEVARGAADNGTCLVSEWRAHIASWDELACAEFVLPGIFLQIFEDEIVVFLKEETLFSRVARLDVEELGRSIRMQGAAVTRVEVDGNAPVPPWAMAALNPAQPTRGETLDPLVWLFSADGLAAVDPQDIPF
jgi:hypothetical protein